MAFEKLNLVNCEAGGVLGTGLAGCRIDRKRVTDIGLLPYGFKFTQDPDKDYMRQLQQSGDLIMLTGIVSFTDNTAEDTIVTREGSGIKTVAGKMPYEYTMLFDNGVNFNKALNTLSSYGRYSMVLFDVDGTMWLTAGQDGVPKGFTVGMFETGKYTGSNGTDSPSESVSFQLINRIEFDRFAAWYTVGELDFMGSDLTGVNETLITLDPIVAASTSIVVSAFLLDKTHSVDGLLVPDFLVKRNGAVITPSAIAQDSVSKKYTLTVTANTAADIVEVSINGIILTPLDTLYKSNTATAIVV